MYVNTGIDWFRYWKKIVQNKCYGAEVVLKLNNKKKKNQEKNIK